MEITPRRALAELKAQHAVLRATMERCIDLADELDAGRCGPTQLLREIARLRLAFASHNRFQEQLLRPLLLEGSQLDKARIDGMKEQHVEEHRSLRASLAPHAGTPMTHELRQVLETMRAHLDREEVVLLRGLIVRDDVVTVDG